MFSYFNFFLNIFIKSSADVKQQLTILFMLNRVEVILSLDLHHHPTALEKAPSQGCTRGNVGVKQKVGEIIYFQGYALLCQYFYFTVLFI